uniref:Matrix remodeling associated 5 n=1 Tax=Leptobrachium leishanense TaxID=445787 RepID=A0A8C5M088_9ANUR
MKTLIKMYGVNIWMFPAIFLLLRLPQNALSCPQSCACYINSEVHCTFRSLTAVPARIPKHVERINLGFNSIQTVAEDSFTGLAKLEMLLIHSNDVHNIPNGAFKDLISLQVFKMSYNKLKVITSHTFHGLSSLTRLHVDHNKIEFIHPNAFHGLTSLRLIHLEGNLLQQLHANTFCTFNFLDYFRQSTLKHLYLSDNMIQTLPANMIQSMPLLENLYLHGNPWTCDCRLKWLLEWEEQSNGVLKCKKDRAYENGQLCAMCSTPKHLQNQEIQSLKDISCSRPLIYSPDRINSSDTYTDDDENDQPVMEFYKDYLGKVILNMTDEHGKKVNLDCEMKKSPEFNNINWNQPHTEEIEINATFRIDFECPMNRENYEKLWKLIAYYSEVPVKLERELMFTDNPKITYRYKQNPDKDSYYYTGVKSLITAEPEWMIQPVVSLQLNRKMSTAKKVTLSFSTHYSQLIHTKEIQYPKNNWVMIDKKVKTSYVAVTGKACQLICNVKSSETPTIQWGLPDGTIVKTSSSSDNRFSVSAGGHLFINAADAMDSGVYHCIAQVKHEIDILTIRVVVQPPTSQISERNTKVIAKTVGESVTLTCNAVANPDADVSWILPDNVIIDSLANKSNAHLLSNGSLVITQSKLTDSGLYLCVAANQHGADHYNLQLEINKKLSEQSYQLPKIKMRPIIKIPINTRVNVIGDDEGSGEKVEQEETEKYHIVKVGSGKSKGSNLPRVTDDGKKRKDRRKMKQWKDTETETDTERDKGSNIAEGRRKFESRRRINMGNKQIDPNQWANILAKVRGRNVQKSTEAPLQTPTEATTKLTYTTKAPSSILRPPMTTTAELETNLDEISADEEEILILTSSPQVTATHYNHDLDATTDETDDYSKIISEGNQETVTPESYTERTMYSTSTSSDINDLVYSTDEEEINNSFIEWENSDTDSTDTTPGTPTMDLHQMQEYTTTHSHYGQYSEDEVSTQASSKVVESNPDYMESMSEDIPSTPVEDETQSIGVHTFSSTAFEEFTSEDIIYSDNSISWTEQNRLHSPTANDIWTTMGMADNDQTFSTELDVTSQQTVTITPAHVVTTPTIDFQFPNTLFEIATTTDTVIKVFNDSIYSEDYAKLTESQFTNVNKENGDSNNLEHERVQVPTSSSVASVQERISLSSTTTTSTVNTPRPYITTLMPTNGNVYYPRRRPNGKRRFRPNRLRHHQNQVNATTQESIRPFVEQSWVTHSYKQSTTKSPFWQTTTINMPSSVNVHSETKTTKPTWTEPFEIRNPDLKMTSTTSAQQHRKLPFPTTMKTLGLPVAAPATTTESLKTHSTANARNNDLLNTESSTVATKKYQSSTFYVKTSNDPSTSSDRDVFSTTSTTANPLKLYEIYNRKNLKYQSVLPIDTPNVAVVNQLPTTIASPVTFSTMKNTLRDFKYGSHNMPTESEKTHSSASIYDEIRTEMNVNAQDNNLKTTGVNEKLHKERKIIKLIEQATISNSVQTSVPTTSNQLTFTTTQHLIVPFTPTNAGNVFKSTVRESPTQATRIVQVNIPSSRQDELDRFYSSRNKVFPQPKQENFKDISGTKFNNSFLNTTKLHSQSHIQHHAIPPVQYSPSRGTVRTPYIGTLGPKRYLITNKPVHVTNKPGITAYAAQNIQERKSPTIPLSTTSLTTITTTVAPYFRPRPISPGKFNQGHRIPPNYRPFGNNVFTDGKVTMAKIPYQGNPYYINPRFQYRYNRTKPYRFNVMPKPPPSTFAAPITDTKTNPLFSLARTTSSAPLTKATTTREITSLKSPFIYPFSSTTSTYLVPQRLPKPSSTINSFIQSNLKPPISSHEEGSKFKHPNVIQPSITISSQGVKPRITTTGFQQLSVPFETDAILPCNAVGEPKPSISWTKVSTGAVMTAKSKIQRFEVFGNGTLQIQHLQLQDRGQYLCTAQNQHGSDKMIITLTVMSQQPKILLTRYMDVTVYLGDTVTMDCSASGVPTPHISWIFPDRKIMRTVSTTESRVMFYENGTLAIKDITFTDRGIFKCLASNVAGADSLTVRVHISALPPIIQQEKLENISLPQGHSIYIHCSAKGAPLPNIRWVLLDGTHVRPSQLANGNFFVFPNGTLYIRNISQKDTGKYECIAINVVGTARRIVWLDIKKLSLNAKITASSPQKTDVSYGSTLRLDCSAAGDPWPRILWRLPSKRLVDSFFSFDSRIKTFANGTLLVYSVTEKDAGDYLCMARNKLGDDYVVLKVNVMMKPAKIQHKNDINHKVTFGGDLKVDCIATGVPNPEISWSLPDGSMVNNVMQSDDSGSRKRRYGMFNNGTLYFNEVGPKDEGDYTCYAVNQIGQDEMRVSVKVVAEKAIIKNKTYAIINVPYGDVVTVSCQAKGEPLPKITWLTPANKPIPAMSDKYQIYRDGTLLIQKAQRSDSGNYTCLAHNSGGEDKKIVQIQVNVLSPKINGLSDKVTTIRETALKDSRILIDCNAEGIPTPRVMWAFPEGVILPAPYYGNRITVHRNGTLDIKLLRKTDSVQLTCIGRNEGGETRLIVHLTVNEPAEKPKFINDNENIVVAEGQAVNINCSVTGFPEPEISWNLPNGTVLKNGNHLHRIFHKTDGTLHISSAVVSDAGTYHCRAVNTAGHADKLVSLQIGQKPQMKNPYNNLISIINGETLQLHCTTHENLKPHISWTLPNGVVIEGPQHRDRISLLQNGTLVVRDTSVYDRGSYLCKATTQYGSSTMNVPVIVIAYPPRITTSPAPVIYARPGSSVQLNCMSIGIPKAEITWILPDRSQLTALAQSRLYGNKFLHPQGTLVIQQISKRDMGYYKCTAKNILGNDTKTTYIHIY